MMLSKNFDLEEFRSHDGADFPVSVVANLKKLSANLEVLRNEIGVPININSGYRSIAHNKEIGGVDGSQHTKGNASDLRTALTPLELYATIVRLIASGRMQQGGLGLYDTFVHYDIRGTRARWDNRKKKVRS